MHFGLHAEKNSGTKARAGVGFIAGHLEQVEHLTHGRDLRCANQDCHMFGVLLEADEIEVDEGEARCAICLAVLVPWTDDAGA